LPVVRVNDRGPVQAGRILDISQSAAAKIGIPKTAMRDVTLEVIEIGNGKTSHQSGGQ
jgi:rare lipoprotein A